MLDGALPAPVLGGRVHGRIELRVGGSAANAALAAARLGARTAVVGRVGADAAGRLVAEGSRRPGWNRCSARDDDEHTGSVVVVGATSIVADPGASARLASDDLPELLEAGAVLVSGYSLLQRGSEPAARAALERARTDWLAVDVASPRLVEAFGADRFFDATRRASVLLANATEARTLTGLEPEEAAAALASHYRVVCIKLGRDGALAVRDRVVVRAEVEPIERTDTLGMGDAFAGGFLFALVGGAELAAALHAGCDSAGTYASSAVTEVVSPDQLAAIARDVAGEVVGTGARRVLLVPPDQTRLHSRAGEIVAQLTGLLESDVERVDVMPRSERTIRSALPSPG